MLLRVRHGYGHNHALEACGVLRVWHEVAAADMARGRVSDDKAWWEARKPRRSRTRLPNTPVSVLPDVGGASSRGDALVGGKGLELVYRYSLVLVGSNDPTRTPGSLA